MCYSVQCQAFADTSVRVRNDAKVVDIHGNITAEPNLSDPRNTEFEKYYINVSENGQKSATSDFYIISDPNAGYMRREITPPAAEQKDNPQQLAQNVKIPPKNYGKTSLMLEYIPTMPVYDNMQFAGPVYGD